MNNIFFSSTQILFCRNPETSRKMRKKCQSRWKRWSVWFGHLRLRYYDWFDFLALGAKSGKFWDTESLSEWSWLTRSSASHLFKRRTQITSNVISIEDNSAASKSSIIPHLEVMHFKHTSIATKALVVIIVYLLQIIHLLRQEKIWTADEK